MTACVCPSVCLSDVAYIGSNSKTKRPRKTKLCTGVPQVTCDSHTDFKVKRSKVKVSRGGGILWRPPIAAQLVDNTDTLKLNLDYPVAQCYDGAAVISGAQSGVQTRIRDKAPQAIYVHCYMHIG